jgi:hypothetical protein
LLPFATLKGDVLYIGYGTIDSPTVGLEPISLADLAR